MPVTLVNKDDGTEIVVTPLPDSSRKFGGEGLHGWVPETVCLAKASPAIKAEPFGPYLKCVQGQCDCKKALNRG